MSYILTMHQACSGPLSYVRERRFRSTCAFMQSDQALSFPLFTCIRIQFSKPFSIQQASFWVDCLKSQLDLLFTKLLSA